MYVQSQLYRKKLNQPFLFQLATKTQSLYKKLIYSLRTQINLKTKDSQEIELLKEDHYWMLWEISKLFLLRKLSMKWMRCMPTNGRKNILKTNKCQCHRSQMTKECTIHYYHWAYHSKGILGLSQKLMSRNLSQTLNPFNVHCNSWSTVNPHTKISLSFTIF